MGREDVQREDEKLQRTIDAKETFETPHGKRTLERMKKLCFYHVIVKPQMGTDNHIDIFQLVRREAQREMITYIESMMNRDPNEKKGITNA